MMKKKTGFQQNTLENAITVLRKLPPEGRDVVVGMIEQLARAGDIRADTPSYVPAEGIDDWVTKMRSEMRSERTIHMYGYLAKDSLAEIPNPSRMDVQRYLTDKLAHGQSPAAVENKRKALASLFRFLYEEGRVSINQMEGVRAIRVPYSEKKPPAPEDIEKVLEVGYERAKDAAKMRMIVTLLMTAGLRISEALGLLKENVDLKSLEITVLGKGNKRRVVPLVKPTAESLGKYINDHPGASPFVFPGNTRHGHAEIHNVEKTLHRACVRAAVKPFTPHQLRHYFATEMLRDGAKLEVVGRILGHSSIGITADIYRHVRTKEMHEAVEEHGPANGRR
ncbi:tyrosine-type recombinase/integrase [Chloroflexota bacterium]